MESARATAALAEASAGLVERHDIAGYLASLLASAIDVLDADAGGVLVWSGDHLELLTASTHEAVALELLQTHAVEGPCVDAHATDTAVSASMTADVLIRWPTFGPVMVAAGFRSVQASPMRWQGSAIGGMGLFRRDGTAFTTEEQTVAQAFADLATLLILQSGVDTESLRQRIRAALGSRVAIEQAKGVLAELELVDMATAYDLLARRALETGDTLTAVAETVIHEARRVR